MKVMQCWDDGVVDDIRLVDILRKHQAKATFNLNPGLHDNSKRGNGWMINGVRGARKLALDEMRDVYEGFVIAGHTMTHPDLTKIPPERATAELVDCRRFIQAFFGQDDCGFAYPGGHYNASVKELVRQAGYLYARTVVDVDGELPIHDPMELPAHCHFLHPEFWAKYEKVRAIDGVFYFWGHSYEMLNDPAHWDEFEHKMARIAADRKAEWIDVRDLFMR